MEEDDDTLQGSSDGVGAVFDPESVFVEEEAENEETADGFGDEFPLAVPAVAKSHQLKEVLEEDGYQKAFINDFEERVLLGGEVGGIETAKDQIAGK